MITKYKVCNMCWRGHRAIWSVIVQRRPRSDVHGLARDLGRSAEQAVGTKRDNAALSCKTSLGAHGVEVIDAGDGTG